MRSIALAFIVLACNSTVDNTTYPSVVSANVSCSDTENGSKIVYNVDEFNDGSVLVNAYVGDNENSAFFAPNQVGWGTAPVQVGRWDISLNRNTLVLSSVYNKVAYISSMCSVDNLELYDTSSSSVPNNAQGGTQSAQSYVQNGPAQSAQATLEQ